MKLKSGREIQGIQDCIGISDKGTAHYGYDGSVERFDSDILTSEERAELAEEMIRRWLAFKDAPPTEFPDWA